MIEWSLDFVGGPRKTGKWCFLGIGFSRCSCDSKKFVDHFVRFVGVDHYCDGFDSENYFACSVELAVAPRPLVAFDDA